MWFLLRSPECAEDFERLMAGDRDVVRGSLDTVSDWRLTRPADVPGQAIDSADYVLIAEIVAVERWEQQASELVERLADDLEHLVSSRGVNLVGAAIEAIGEEDFGDAVGRLVFAPLGLQHTVIDDGRRRQTWASPYEVTGARKAIPAPSVDLSNRLPSGGFRSTAEDLARFGSRLGDRTFLRKSTQDTFFSQQHLADGSGTHYGLGFEAGEAPFGRVVGHTGNVVGGTAFLLAQPRAGVAMAMATNVGYVTARTTPDLSAVPDPPALFAPFVTRALRRP